MRVRFKVTGQIEEYPAGILPASVRAMIGGGTAEILEEPAAGSRQSAAETAALRSGDREQAKGKKTAARRL